MCVRVVSFPDGMNKTLNRIIEFLHFLKLTCLSWPRKTSDSEGDGGDSVLREKYWQNFPLNCHSAHTIQKPPRLPQKNRTQSVRQTFPLGNFLAFPIDTSHANCTKPTKKNEKKSGENRGWAVEKWAGHSTGAIKTDIRSKWAWPNRVKHYLEVWEKVFGKAIRDRWECNQPKKKNVRKSGKRNKLLRRVASVNLNAVQELEVCEIFKTLTALRYIAIRYYIFYICKSQFKYESPVGTSFDFEQIISGPTSHFKRTSPKMFEKPKYPSLHHHHHRRRGFDVIMQRMPDWHPFEVP